MTETPLISFYRGSGTDHAGRHLDEILSWDDRALESVHDYIQWLFPNVDPSRANAFAPLLTAADRETFRSDADLGATVSHAFGRMLAFYGLERIDRGGEIEIRPSGSWSERAPHWLQPSNHNHLRLTRIMKCLVALGFESDARALQRTLLDLAQRTHPRSVTRATVRFWTAAVD